jgi:hypothetical protein
MIEYEKYIVQGIEELPFMVPSFLYERQGVDRAWYIKQACKMRRERERERERERGKRHFSHFGSRR